MLRCVVHVCADARHHRHPRRAAAPRRRTPDVRKPRASSTTPTARASVLGAHAVVARAPHQRLPGGVERSTAAAAGELHGIVALTEERRDDLALRGGHEPHVRHERRRTLHEHRTHRKEEHRVVRGRRHVRRRRRCARVAVRRVARSSRKLAGRADEPLLGEPPLAAFADWLSKDTTQSSDNHAKSKRLAVK